MLAHIPSTDERPPFIHSGREFLSSVRLSGGKGLANAGTALTGVEAELLTLDDLGGLLDDLLTLGKDELDVAGARHVGVDLISKSALLYTSLGPRGTYTTVGTVRPPTLLRGLVDLDVLDNQGTSVKTLGISVGLGVLEEAEEELGGLGGPTGLGDTELLAYSGVTVSRIRGIVVLG